MVNGLKKKTKLNRLKLPMFDIPFFIGVMLLLVVGLIMLFSAGYADAFSKTGDSYFYIRKQIISAIIGLVGMIAVSFIPYTFYRRFAYIFYFVCVFLLVLVLIVSRDAEKRWLYLGSFQFQPSELAKIAVIIVLADYISRNKNKMKKFSNGIIVPGLMFMLITVLIGVETHLSGAILVLSIGLVMIIAGGCNLLHLAPMAGVGVTLGVLLVSFNSYMQQRIHTWLNPESDLLGAGWQPTQSLITIGSGGLFGLGYGKSRQKYMHMSEPQNDFIFSIVSEELGFIGAIFILALFIFLIWRGIHIAMRAPDTFSSLIVIGIMGLVAVQVIFNIAVVTNTVPVTGVPLPFFSYGGTALVVLLLEMGLILHISRYAHVDRGDADTVMESEAETETAVVEEELE